MGISCAVLCRAVFLFNVYLFYASLYAPLYTLHCTVHYTACAALPWLAIFASCPPSTRTPERTEQLADTSLRDCLYVFTVFTFSLVWFIFIRHEGVLYTDCGLLRLTPRRDGTGNGADRVQGLYFILLYL